MRIKNKNQYQAILFLGAVLMTLQVFTIENRFFWKLFYGFNEHQRKIKRKLSPGYATKFSDICDLESKDTNVPFKQIMKQQRRKLSEKPDDIECEWTMAVPFDRADLDNIHGILLTSYPGAGMRLAWMHVQGLTGHEVQDDFEECDGHHEAFGIVKTQYPHLEGVWSWGANEREVIYVMRNPRWAIPSYHTLLHEIDYAHDCNAAHTLIDNVFSLRPPQWKWQRWRDLRIKDEILLYEWHIDFWMENGTVYWQDWDFERNGQWPFRWNTEEEKAVREKDLNCQYQNIDCVPTAAIAYEFLYNNFTGPVEANKLAKVFEDKKGINIIEEEARECMWHATMNQEAMPNNFDREGPGNDDYGFTYKQMQMIQDMLVRVQTKYSSDKWIGVGAAEDIVKYVTYYIQVNEEEMSKMVGNYPPTPSPNPEYMRGLVAWYKTIGRGDRYNKASVQSKYGFWKYNSHLYDTGAPSVAPII